MDRSLKKSLTSQEKWLRFLFMIFFFYIYEFISVTFYQLGDIKKVTVIKSF